MKTDRQKYNEAVWRQGQPARDREEARMLAEDTPEPSRITCALDWCQLYGPEVDQALGGEEPMVDEWESGDRIPTGEQIKKLAEMTGFMPKWFYGEPLAEIDAPWLDAHLKAESHA